MFDFYLCMGLLAAIGGVLLTGLCAKAANSSTVAPTKIPTNGYFGDPQNALPTPEAVREFVILLAGDVAQLQREKAELKLEVARLKAERQG